jgi:hypothetical protein
MLAAGETTSEAELRAIYRTDDVVVEDEEDTKFNGRSNQWKMHYKIEACHLFAQRAALDHDLIIRIRPDVALSVTTPICYEAVADLSNTRFAIITEYRSDINVLGKFIGDKFMMGAPEPMRQVASTFSRMNALFAESEGLDFPADWEGHTTLGTVCAMSGIRSFRLAGFDAPHLLNPPLVAPALLFNTLREDVEERGGGDGFDQAFLAAAQAAAA